MFPDLKTLAFLLHSIQIISFIFQVSPNYPSPCQPCHCDPVGSLSEVCVKDEKYARRGEDSRELPPWWKDFHRNSVHTVRILTSNSVLSRTPFLFAIIIYFVLYYNVWKPKKNKYKRKERKKIDHLLWYMYIVTWHFMIEINSETFVLKCLVVEMS